MLVYHALAVLFNFGLTALHQPEGCMCASTNIDTVLAIFLTGLGQSTDNHSTDN